MKGYSYLTEEESKKFVKSYELKGDNVEIVMNSGEVLVYKATEEALAKLNSMQEAAYDKRNKKELDRNIKDRKNNKGIMIVSTSLAVVLSIFGIASAELNSIFGAMAGASLGLAGLNAVGLVKKTLNIKELTKQKIYMDNQDLFTNDVITNRNVNQCLSNKKKAELYRQETKTGSAFNLTSIDNLTLKELLELRMNILREEDFGLESANEDIKTYRR